MLSQEAIQKILGIDDKIISTPEEMAKNLTITFFPFESKDDQRYLTPLADLVCG